MRSITTAAWLLVALVTLVGCSDSTTNVGPAPPAVQSAPPAVQSALAALSDDVLNTATAKMLKDFDTLDELGRQKLHSAVTEVERRAAPVTTELTGLEWDYKLLTNPDLKVEYDELNDSVEEWLGFYKNSVEEFSEFTKAASSIICPLAADVTATQISDAIRMPKKLEEAEKTTERCKGWLESSRTNLAEFEKKHRPR